MYTDIEQEQVNAALKQIAVSVRRFEEVGCSPEDVRDLRKALSQSLAYTSESIRKASHDEFDTMRLCMAGARANLEMIPLALRPILSIPHLQATSLRSAIERYCTLLKRSHEHLTELRVGAAIKDLFSAMRLVEERL